METMDHFTYELLSQPLPPGFDPFSGSSSVGGSYGATMDVEQLDNYFRAIEVLPPLPPANAHVQPAPAASSYDDDDDNVDIGASLRAMETDARQRLSPGIVDPVARAALVPWMHDFVRHFDVGQDALHRAVSYADRFLSLSASRRAAATPATAFDIDADANDDYQLRLLGAAAVYAASKYEEDSRDAAAPRMMRMNAGDIAATCGFAASQEVLDAERVLLARLCVEPAHDRELQVRRWSRELEGLTGYKPMDVYGGLDCMYNMLPRDPGFDISPLLFVDPDSSEL